MPAFTVFFVADVIDLSLDAVTPSVSPVDVRTNTTAS